MPAHNENLAAEKTFRAEIAALFFALTFPSLLTWVYFILLADRNPALQQAVYSIGKGIQFGVPIAWVWLVRRESLGWPKPRRDGVLLGGLLGAVIVLVTLVVYRLGMKPAGVFDTAGELIRQRVTSAGIDSVAKYAGLAVFYSVCHSLLEEYYWRWFLFARLRSLVPLPAAIVISSLGFMAHHVIVLSHYFGWGSSLSLFTSLSVAVGGAVWAWLYHHSRSLYGPWLSHCLVDAGIFLIGYDLLRPQW